MDARGRWFDGEELVARPSQVFKNEQGWWAFHSRKAGCQWWFEGGKLVGALAADSEH